MGGMAVRQVPSRWGMDKFKVFQIEPFYSSLAQNSNVPPLGRSSLLLPVGRHPSVPLHRLHQHHCRRGLAYFLHLKLLVLNWPNLALTGQAGSNSRGLQAQGGGIL